MTSPADIIFKFLEKKAQESASKSKPFGATAPSLKRLESEFPILRKGWRPDIIYPVARPGQRPELEHPIARPGQRPESIPPVPKKPKSKKAPSAKQPALSQKAMQTFLNVAPQGPAQIAAAASTLPLLGALWYSIRKRRAALKPAIKATESLSKLNPALAIGGGVLGGLILSKLLER